jgi:hypothetical protein
MSHEAGLTYIDELREKITKLLRNEASAESTLILAEEILGPKGGTEDDDVFLGDKALEAESVLEDVIAAVWDAKDEERVKRLHERVLEVVTYQDPPDVNEYRTTYKLPDTDTGKDDDQAWTVFYLTSGPSDDPTICRVVDAITGSDIPESMWRWDDDIIQHVEDDWKYRNKDAGADQ